jgi:hypothetical protein
MRDRLIAIALSVVVVAYVSARAANAPRDHTHPLTIVLRDTVELGDGDLQTLDAGGVVARTLPTTLRREVAVVGVVWIDVPEDFFVAQYRDIETFEGDSDRVPQIGRFSHPAALDDVQTLTLDKGDIEAIDKCRSGDCAVKLTAPAMARLAQETNGTVSGAADRANRVVRPMLVELIQDYRTNGNPALGSYEDHDRPFPVAAEFAEMLRNDPLLVAQLPALHQYLNDYPNRSLPAAEDFFYWSKVSFGLKPTIRANHVTIYAVPGEGPILHALASKQLYSSHYFNTVLELRLLIEDARRAGAVGFFLVNVNRSRVDRLSGLSGLIIRSTILHKTRDAMRAYLRDAKETLEREWRRKVTTWTAADVHRSTRPSRTLRAR